MESFGAPKKGAKSARARCHVFGKRLRDGASRQDVQLIGAP